MSSEATLQKIRMVNRVVVRALTFEGKDVWDLDRIQKSIGDVNELVKVFLACMALTNPQQAKPSTASPEKNCEAVGKGTGVPSYVR
jgi:hypothetical protein